MKKVNLTLFIIGVLLSLYACRNGAVVRAEYIRVDNYSPLEEQSFLFERLDGNVIVEDIFGNPVRVSRIDSLLFLVNANTEKLFHIYSLPDNRILGFFGSVGRGPNELFAMDHIFEGREKGTAGGYDLSQRRWLEFSVSETLQAGNLVVTDSKDIPRGDDVHYMQNPEWINDREFVATGFFSYENRCFITNMNLDSYLEFINPDVTFYKNLPDRILADIYSTHLSVKPDKSRLVLAGRYIDMIEIFNIDGTHLFTGIGPNNRLDVSIDFKSSAQNQSFVKTPETRRAFTYAKSTDEYIYLLYSGKQNKDPSNYSRAENVYVLDWNGKPIAHFELEAPVCDIAISEDNTSLWAIQPLPSPSLVRYDLKLP